MASNDIDSEKQAFEHRDGASSSVSGAGKTKKHIEGAPAGWCPEMTNWDDPIEKSIM